MLLLLIYVIGPSLGYLIAHYLLEVIGVIKNKKGAYTV